MLEFFEPLRRVRVADELAAQIKESILNGKIKLGDRLPSERKLAEYCSISRVTVREAFRILEKDGLLTIKRGVDGGAFVAAVEGERVEDCLNDFFSFGEVNVENIFEACLYIEPFVAKLAAKKCSQEDLELLEQTIEKGQQMIDINNLNFDIQASFHSALAHVSKNPIFIVIVNSLMTFLEKNVVTPDKDINLYLADQRFHRSVFNAIKNKDEEKAFLMMKDHALTFSKMYNITEL